MRASRTFVVGYMVLVSVLAAVLIAPGLAGLALASEPLDADDWYGAVSVSGLVGFLWLVGMAAGAWTLRRRSRD